MRSAPTNLLLLAAVMVMGLSGCIRDLRHIGPPPPAYACEDVGPYGYGHAYGYDTFGGYNECVDDGQYYSRRDLRRLRRDARLGRHGRLAGHAGRRADTMNGLPVVAAYIVPIEMLGDGGMCGPWECCEPSCGEGFCGDGFPCGDCGPCGGGLGCEISGYPEAMMGDYPEEMGWESVPSEAYPPSYLPGPGGYEGQMLSPVPVPPAEEGPWNPPATEPSSPLTQPEPEAQLPVESATWLPSRLP